MRRLAASLVGKVWGAQVSTRPIKKVMLGRARLSARLSAPVKGGDSLREVSGRATAIGDGATFRCSICLGGGLFRARALAVIRVDGGAPAPAFNGIGEGLLRRS